MVYYRQTLLNLIKCVEVNGIARSEPDGTQWFLGGEVKGKDANGVGSQQPCTVRRNTVYTIAVRWSSSRLNWHPRWFKWTRPFCWKTKSGFCACAITFRTCYNMELNKSDTVNSKIPHRYGISVKNMLNLHTSIRIQWTSGMYKDIILFQTVTKGNHSKFL